MSKSPFKTGIAVANSMVGTSLLVLPVNYLQKGIFPNTIGAIIMCIVMGSTASTIGSLVSGRTKQFFTVVKKQLGTRWSNLLAVLGALITTLVACIIFLLLSDILYEMMDTLFDFVSGMGARLFRCLLLVIFVPFCFLNSLELVVRTGFVSMGLIWLYVFTIIYSFIENIPNIDSNAFTSKPITLPNLQYWLSVQGFSYICHPTLDAVLKQNSKSRQNTKAVIIGYIFSFLVMTSCGILGALALYKRDKKKEDDNVIDYFVGVWQYYVLAVSICVYLLSIFGIFPFVSRMQVYEILPEKFKQNPQKTHLKMKAAFIILFLVLSIIFVVTETSPGSVMGFIVAVVCFYVCYLLPILIKLRRYRRVEGGGDGIGSDTVITVSGVQNKESLMSGSSSSLVENDEQQQKLIEMEDKNKILLYKVCYIAVLIFGTILMLSQIVSLVYSLFN